MLTLDLEKYGSLLNALLGMLSGKADSVKIKMGNSKIECYFYDKVNSLEITASFDAVTDAETIQYFALPAERLKAIITKRKSIKVNLNENMLHYSYPTVDKAGSVTKGKVETEEYNSKFKFPNEAESTFIITPAIFAFYDRVKLKPIGTDREMMLYGRYIAQTKTLYLGGGDNFHLALLTCKEQKISTVDFDLNIPFKYVELARRIANYNKDHVNLRITDKGMIFFTSNVVVILPLISSEGSKMNITSLLKVYQANRVAVQESFTIDVSEMKLFLSNSVVIKETGKSADLLIEADNKKLNLAIETSHGTVTSEHTLKKTLQDKQEIKVSCVAIEDLLSKYIDSKGSVGITKSCIILTEIQSENTTLELSTVGVE